MVYGSVASFMQQYGIGKECVIGRYNFNKLEDIIQDCIGIKRVFYLEFPVTIVAGDSRKIEVVQYKVPSHDYYCSNSENRGVQGYDMVTKLGSNLQITELTGSLVNTEGIEVVRQNYGFDLENGVDMVKLDPAGEQYYIEIRVKEK